MSKQRLRRDSFAAYASPLGAWWLPGLLCLGSLAAAMSLSMRAPSEGPVALVFPPWWSEARSLAAAAEEGALVRLGALPFIVVVSPRGHGAGRPQAARAAWLALDPAGLGGCSGPPSTRSAAHG